MTDWHGLYREGWTRLIVPEAFAHPAKVARGLARRIYEHCREEQWLTPGDVVLDPFAGIGGFALDAMLLGCTWIGVELEPKFVALAEQNIALWNRRFGTLPGWGSACIVQGDSRQLGAVLAEAGCAVSSPPYSRLVNQGETADPEKIAARETRYLDRHPEFLGKRPEWTGYSSNPANLGNLTPGSVEAAISSPPFASSEARGLPRERVRDTSDPQQHGSAGPEYIVPRSDGQLAAMPDAGFAAAVNSLDSRRLCVSSPPFCDAEPFKDKSFRQNQADQYTKGTYETRGFLDPEYEENAKTRSLSSFRNPPPTFWSASRLILDQLHAVIRPGGIVIWVLKDFIRKGERQDFCGQWQRLCEAVGFRTLHVHRAWLIEDHGTQGRLDGGETRLVTERKSFFRRIHEVRVQARLHWTTVAPAQQAAWLAQARDTLGGDARPGTVEKMAQVLAWKAAGPPVIAEATRIDWETVLCLERP